MSQNVFVVKTREKGIRALSAAACRTEGWAFFSDEPQGIFPLDSGSFLRKTAFRTTMIKAPIPRKYQAKRQFKEATIN